MTLPDSPNTSGDDVTKISNEEVPARDMVPAEAVHDLAALLDQARMVWPDSASLMVWLMDRLSAYEGLETAARAWLAQRRSPDAFLRQPHAELIRLADAVDALPPQDGPSSPPQDTVERPAPVERGVHPEDYCHRCGGPNVSWSAPSPLWNAVMRGNDINGDDEFGGIVCPLCFAQLAKARAGAAGWRFSADVVRAELKLTTPSGRVWDPEEWMWVRPAAPPITDTEAHDGAK